MVANLFFIFLVSNKPSTPISDPYHNSDSIMKMKSMHLDRRLSPSVPKQSTIIESPAGKSVQPSSSNAEKHEQQPVVQKHLPQLPHEQQQREERHPQQVFPTINASYAPLASRNVPQISKILEVTENPLSRCVPRQNNVYCPRSKNVYLESQRSLHSVPTLQRMW